MGAKAIAPRPAAPGGLALGSDGARSARGHFSTPAPLPQEPVALAVYKPGRGRSGDGWVIVAKITRFVGDDTPILAVAWRSQSGTQQAISLPETVLDLAERAGCQRFYLRDDRRRLMWTCPLEIFRRGRLGPDGERYVPLAWLEPVRWREWLFASTTLRLRPPEPAEPAAQQLALPGFGGER